MAQPQDLLAFHQSSPESSKGGGDSYKHEGTPDTRLTAFSPDETSVRSSKVMKLPSLRVPEPAGFPAQISNAKPFGSIAGLQLEKDPFVSSGNTLKPDQRLSPTASAFRPFSNPLTPRGVVDTATPFEGAFDGGVEGGSHHGTHHGTIPVSSALSTDLSLSRCLEISSLTQIVTVDDVEAYLAVRSLPCHVPELSLTPPRRDWKSWDLLARGRWRRFPRTSTASSASATSETPAWRSETFSWAASTGRPSSSPRLTWSW